MDKRIIHTECDCLWSKDVFDDKCRKRWFLVNDIELGEFKYIGVCNQHLSLLINDKFIKDESWVKNRATIYEKVVEDIISKYINIGSIWSTNFNDNDLVNKTISFTICERPYIFRRISLLDSIELYFKNNSWQLRDKIISRIKEYLENENIYKKYKTKYKQSLALCNKLKKTYGDEKENIINEILINILEMNIKNK